MEDFVHAAKETNFISGIPEDFGGSGRFFIPTAQGVFYSLKATNQFLYGSNDISGKVYAIQGLGKVGRKIAETLIEKGAEIYVTDVNERAVNEFLVTAKLLGRFCPHSKARGNTSGGCRCFYAMCDRRSD